MTLNNDENSWYTNTALVRRNETVTVKEGDTFTVVVGAKSWPSHEQWHLRRVRRR